MGPRRLISLLVLALALGSSACQKVAKVPQEIGDSTLEHFGIVDPEVLGVIERGPYLHARFRTRTGEIDMLFPTNEACREVLRTGQVLQYSKLGTFGRVSHGEQRCEAVGTMSLARWRDRQARRRTSGPAPTDVARFRELWRDEEYVFVRGRFPFVNRIGIASYDIVAALPNEPICERPIERGEATIQYANSGPKPFRLISGKGQCILGGVALPPESIPADL